MGTVKCGMALCAALLLTACVSRFGEKHYFRSEDESGAPINYYRVTVKGGTFLTNSQYLSGYFDEDAVNTYFGQTSSKPGQKPGGVKLTPVNGDETRRLVLLLSSDSDTVASDIGQLADNTALMDDLTNLIVGGNSISKKLRVEQAKALALVSKSERLLGNLPEKGSASAAKKPVLELVNDLAADLGNSQRFASLADAERWFQSNRDRLLIEDLP